MAAGGSALERMSPLAKVITGFVFAALTAAVYFVIFFTDVDSSISAEHDKETKLHSDLAKAEEAKAAYQKDLDERTRRQQVAREQKKVLPDDPEMPSFLAAVQNMATSSGINLTSYTPQDEVKAQFYAKVPMALTITGRFNQVARFFYSVGKLDRIINIENIAIKTEANSGAKGTDGEAEVLVEVKCLATAFRALKSGEGGEGRGRQQ